MSRIEKTSAIVGALLLLIATLSQVRVNTTKSIPLGFYRITDDPVSKGSYVIFCPPKRELFDIAKKRGYIGAGFCPGGYGQMMKRVAAAERDVVVVGDDGVRVNGQLLPFSAPVKFDKSGRPLPMLQPNTFRLNDTELFLMSDQSSTSFDGRYFGPVDRTQIKSVIRPVFTWN